MTLLTVKEYAERINLPVSTLRSLCKKKEIPAVKIGVSWRIDPETADEAIQKMFKVAANKTAVLKPKNSGSFLERLKAL